MIPTLLGIFAHPDDESFGPGGTLARYAAEGANVHVIIATDGIAGSVEDESYRKSHDSLAQVRSTELSNAALELGVSAIWSLPYRDSGMRGAQENEHPSALIQQPIEHLTTELQEYMMRLRPQVVVTHDPFGGYGHPDHVRCCQAATAAFHTLRQHAASGDTISSNATSGIDTNGANMNGLYQPEKLYYTAFDKRMLKIMVRLMPLIGQDPSAIGRNKDINLVEISTWDTPVHAKIDVSGYLDRKNAASQAHASQYGGGPAFIRILPPFLLRRFLSTEGFTRAFPAPNGLEVDLFEGI